jgi:transcriptional regulator with XRE-family HTH domain
MSAPTRMSGDDLQRFRERRNLSRAELAELINSSLNRSYSAETVSRWERNARPISRPVATLIEQLTVSGGLSGNADPYPDSAAEPPSFSFPEDTAPGDSHPQADVQAPILSGSSAWAKACEELWEMVAAGLGMAGAAIGNHALVADGAIIAADARALGEAYGRLAETNETFRRMLVGMTEGGAWVQVALVTGTTASKCWQSHAAIAESQRAYQQQQNGHPDLFGDEQPAREPTAA